MKKRKDKDLAHIDHYRYRQLLYFCFQYNTWKQEIEEMNKNLKPDGMHYDGMPKARSISSGDGAQSHPSGGFAKKD